MKEQPAEAAPVREPVRYAPTNGLDREGIALLIELLAERAKTGSAAVVATHDRAFIEQVATAKIAITGGRAVPDPATALAFKAR